VRGNALDFDETRIVAIPLACDERLDKDFLQLMCHCEAVEVTAALKA
jgi:hypothetical protein